MVQLMLNIATQNFLKLMHAVDEVTIWKIYIFTFRAVLATHMAHLWIGRYSLVSILPRLSFIYKIAGEM